jgi:hypothetical protein
LTAKILVRVTFNLLYLSRFFFLKKMQFYQQCVHDYPLARHSECSSREKSEVHCQYCLAPNYP